MIVSTAKYCLHRDNELFLRSNQHEIVVTLSRRLRPSIDADGEN